MKIKSYFIQYQFFCFTLCAQTCERYVNLLLKQKIIFTILPSRENITKRLQTTWCSKASFCYHFKKKYERVSNLSKSPVTFPLLSQVSPDGQKIPWQSQEYQSPEHPGRGNRSHVIFIVVAIQVFLEYLYRKHNHSLNVANTFLSRCEESEYSNPLNQTYEAT